MSLDNQNNFKFSNSEELFARSLKVAPGGVHSPVRSFKGLGRPPVFFEKAQGAYLTSVEGKDLIDFCQSFGPLILGHRDEDIEAHVIRMVKTAWTFGAAEPYSLALAEWITTELPWIEKVRFVSSGTEAVMSALRVARAATGRQKILKFDGCYHGHADSLLVKSGSGLAGEATTTSAGITSEAAEQTLVVSLDNDQALEEVFAREGKNIAAVILEPLPANYGLLIQRKEFLEKIATLAKKSGALLIFDEVISGFRVGLGGMAADTGITPDLVTYGKIIGGGFPVGCYGGRKDLMDLVAPNGNVYQAGTLSANPIGMVAGLETLKKMKAVNGWQVLNQRTSQFVSKLNEGFKLKGLSLTVDTYGSLFWIRDCSGIQSEEKYKPLRSIDQISQNQGHAFKELFLNTLDRGVYLAPNAYEVGFLSLAHTDKILNEAADIIIGCAK